MKYRVYLQLMPLVLLLFLPLHSFGAEVKNYEELKKAIFDYGHNVSCSFILEHSGFTVEVKNARFFFPETSSNKEDFFTFSISNKTLSNKAPVEELKIFRVFKNVHRIDGSKYNVSCLVRLIDTKKGSLISENYYYLLLGKTIHFFDNTVIQNTATQRKGAPEASDFGTFLKWFSGEFDNYTQALQDKINKIKYPHRQLHSVIIPANLSHFEGHTFYVQQYLDGDPEKIYRQRIYEVSWNPFDDVIETKIYRFKENGKKYKDAYLHPKILKDLRPESLELSKGCEVYWKKRGNKFYGSNRKNSCVFISSKSGKKLVISEKLILSNESLWILENTFDNKGNVVYGRTDGEYYKLNKCRFYMGSISIKKEKKEEYYLFDNLKFHDQGMVIPLVDKKTKKVLFRAQLLKTMPDKNGPDRLKFIVYKEKDKKPLFYTWTMADADQIGVDLGWFKAAFRLTKDIKK